MYFGLIALDAGGEGCIGGLGIEASTYRLQSVGGFSSQDASLDVSNAETQVLLL